ncbi:hypothetical protein, partial [Mycoplasmoides pneumoniae]|uniref:hypothetical protein n=1 Tax=Mycoplasmoides pneumoniae TaxID=2104 RepID=UPI001F1FDBEC
LNTVPKSKNKEAKEVLDKNFFLCIKSENSFSILLFFFFFGKPFEEKEINWNFGLTQSTLAVNCCYFCPLD